MRTVGGVLLGLLLFFPGIVLLQWISVNVLGAYAAMTLTDGCLVMIIILLCVNLVRGTSPVSSRVKAPVRHTPRRESYPGEPQLEYLPGERAARERRQPTSRRRATSPSKRRESNR